MQLSKETIKEIADNLELGLRCFVNIETHEVVAMPDENQHPDMETEAWKEEMEKVENDPEQYKEIESMRSSDSYQVMEDFVETIDDAFLKGRLTQAIEGHKPFANFMLQIDRSGPYREMWFAFRTQRTIDWVKDQFNADML